jgi:hypothetical protein
MKYQWKLLLILALLTSGMAAADSVVKTLYIDGVKIGEATVPAALSYSYDHLTIGAEGSAGGWRYNEYNGKLDEFAIYSGVLSSTRIAAHYAALASGYVTQVTTDNPLLYLRFEDPNIVNGGVADNIGSVSVDGTYIDNVTASAGAVGNAAVLGSNGEEPDGPGDCVDVPDTMQALSLEDITIEFWMNSTADPNTFPRLFQHNGSWESSVSYGLALADANSIVVIGGGASNFFNSPATVWVTDGNWHHVVVTYDSTIDPPTPYVDAVMADNPLAYYRFEDASGANGAVCADSATRAYKNGEYINLNPQTSGIADIALVPGMENLGKAAQLHGADVSGNGNCISIYDGWSSSYPTTIAKNADGSARQTLSIEFWMQSSSPANYPRIMQHNNGGAGGFGIGSYTDGDGGILTMMGGNNTWYTGSGNVFDGDWHHVVVTYQPGETEPNDIYEYIYIDGVGIWGNTVSTGSHLSVPSDFLTLGNDQSKYYVSNAFTGLIDEVAFYDTALDAERVWDHYSAATGIVRPYNVEVMTDNPVLYLRFESSTPLDSSVNNYWVAYNTGVQIRPFETSFGIGSCAYLSNSSTNAIAAGPAATMPTDLLLTGNQYAFADGDITFEFWMNSTEMDAYGTIFQQGRTETVAPGIGNAGGNFRVLNGNGGWSYAFNNVGTGLNGKWHHIVLTYDEIDPNHMDIQLYKDGVLTKTSISGTTGNVKLGPELNQLVIGGIGNYTATNPGNRYYGLIDEFAVYAGILDPARIAVHYATGLAATQPKTCAQVWVKGEGLPGDINKDCKVDFTDFVEIASDWLRCNDPARIGTQGCTANW